MKKKVITEHTYKIELIREGLAIRVWDEMGASKSSKEGIARKVNLMLIRIGTLLIMDKHRNVTKETRRTFVEVREFAKDLLNSFDSVNTIEVITKRYDFKAVSNNVAISDNGVIVYKN